MKKTVILLIIVGAISVGTICAMERQRLNALPEQMDIERARREEEMRRRERLDKFDRELDRVWEQMNREHKHQQLLENAAEGATS